MTAHPKKSSCHSIASDIGARGPARKPVGRYARLDNNTRRTATAGAQQKQQQQQQQQHQQPREYYVAPPTPPRAFILPTPFPHPRTASAPNALPSRFHRRSPLLATPRNTPHWHPNSLPTSISPPRPLPRVAVPTTCCGHPYGASEGGRAAGRGHPRTNMCNAQP